MPDITPKPAADQGGNTIDLSRVRTWLRILGRIVAFVLGLAVLAFAGFGFFLSGLYSYPSPNADNGMSWNQYYEKMREYEKEEAREKLVAFAIGAVGVTLIVYACRPSRASKRDYPA